MANVAMIGAQWGDEGKGKVVDWLASRPISWCASRAATTPAIRCGGRPDLQAVAAALGRLVRGKLGIIGNGVVIDPRPCSPKSPASAAQGLT